MNLNNNLNINLETNSLKDHFELIIARPETKLLSDSDLQNFFGNSRILIIGAGGSIGSALARRLAFSHIKNVFFLDRDESALHGLALELSSISATKSDNYFIGDIRDKQSIRDVIDEVRPTIVIHAAALKHLVTLERFPREGYLTNILGTLNIAELCVDYEVAQFVNISTDKAANPISVLGKTKKIAELITEEVFSNTQLIQCSVRFGNVFASRGSVIETFIHQIKNSIPVTITDMKVARFFMSQNEAANLVLAATSLKQSGTYIQNMGQEVLITDVIDQIAIYLKLPYSIRIIGLQKGEKMHEELYDGPTSATDFSSISRSIHVINIGLVEKIRENLPTSNDQALKLIELLISRIASN
jgi:FlaA1/EpsC-like NDP-sugar epimerase